MAAHTDIFNLQPYNYVGCLLHYTKVLENVTFLLHNLVRYNIMGTVKLSTQLLLNLYYVVRIFYTVDKYGPSPTKERPLKGPLFLGKGPNDEIFVRDDATQRLVVYHHRGDKLEYSRCIDGNCSGYRRFQDITGIAVGTEYLYVADRMLDTP